jgi:hypothetical protein
VDPFPTLLDSAPWQFVAKQSGCRYSLVTPSNAGRHDYLLKTKLRQELHTWNGRCCRRQSLPGIGNCSANGTAGHGSALKTAHFQEGSQVSVFSVLGVPVFHGELGLLGFLDGRLILEQNGNTVSNGVNAAAVAALQDFLFRMVRQGLFAYRTNEIAPETWHNSRILLQFSVPGSQPSGRTATHHGDTETQRKFGISDLGSSWISKHRRRCVARRRAKRVYDPKSTFLNPEFLLCLCASVVGVVLLRTENREL